MKTVGIVRGFMWASLVFSTLLVVRTAEANKAILIIGESDEATLADFNKWSEQLYKGYYALHHKLGYSHDDIIVVYSSTHPWDDEYAHAPVGVENPRKEIFVKDIRIPLDYTLSKEGLRSAFEDLARSVTEDEAVFVAMHIHGKGYNYNGSDATEFLLENETISMWDVAKLIEDISKKCKYLYAFNNSCHSGFWVRKLADIKQQYGTLNNVVAMSSTNWDPCRVTCPEMFGEMMNTIINNPKDEPAITPARLFEKHAFDENSKPTSDGSLYWEGEKGLGATFDLRDPGGDPDGDGVLNEKDNCVVDYNPRQLDCNENGIGDECDNDQTPCVMLTSLSTRIVRTRYELGNFKMYQNATPEYIDLSYKTMGEGIHDVQIRWCDCSPWDDDGKCRTLNCDMVNLDKQYPLHFNHRQWHMMSLAKRQEDIQKTKAPVRAIGNKKIHQLRVNCPLNDNTWSKEGVDPWTGLVTRHCTPEKQDFGQEYEYGRTWDWTNEIWWQANDGIFKRQDPDREYSGYIWVRPEKSVEVKENKAFTNEFVRFDLKRPGWSYSAPSQEPIFVDERDWVMYDPIEDIVNPVQEPIVDGTVKPLTPVVTQPAMISPLVR